MSTPEQRKTVRFWFGLVIGAFGLACAVVGMVEHDHAMIYVGFGVAVIGAGVVPPERFADVLPWVKKP